MKERYILGIKMYETRACIETKESDKIGQIPKAKEKYCRENAEEWNLVYKNVL